MKTDPRGCERNLSEIIANNDKNSSNSYVICSSLSCRCTAEATYGSQLFTHVTMLYLANIRLIMRLYTELDEFEAQVRIRQNSPWIN